jgi:hypothetical protein
MDGRPAYTLVVRRLCLVLVVIQASGVAAPTGAANATLTTTASTRCTLSKILCARFFPLPSVISERDESTPRRRTHQQVHP